MLVVINTKLKYAVRDGKQKKSQNSLLNFGILNGK